MGAGDLPFVATFGDGTFKRRDQGVALRVKPGLQSPEVRPVTATKDFEEKFTRLNQRFNQFGELSATITQQFSKLEKASRAAITEYKSRNFPENQWVKLGPKLDDVQTALGLMNGQWNALKSDLTDLQKLMANQQLDDVDIEVGLLTWEDITASAKGFVTNIPAQRKYLTGENYYDDVPLSEDSYYLIINALMDSEMNRGVLIPADNNLVIVPLWTSLPSDTRKEWDFAKTGADGGKYSIAPGVMAMCWIRHRCCLLAHTADSGGAFFQPNTKAGFA
jgi:hypothetical protein